MKFLRLVCLVGVAMTGSVHAGNLIILDPAPSASAPTASAAPAFAGNLIISGEAPAAQTAPAAPSQPIPPIVSAVSAKPTLRSWVVKHDDLTLANVFTRWAKDAGYRVLWDARKNVMVDGADSLSGSFEDAVTAVLQGPAVALGPYPLEVCFYANKPPLARITRKGDQDKECN